MQSHVTRLTAVDDRASFLVQGITGYVNVIWRIPVGSGMVFWLMIRDRR